MNYYKQYLGKPLFEQKNIVESKPLFDSKIIGTKKEDKEKASFMLK
jgi:hypothetical protein